MLKDERDDLMQDDESLDDMIHQYNEESELRRKINEMKKQKEASIPKEDDEEKMCIRDRYKRDRICGCAGIFTQWCEGCDAWISQGNG